MHRFKAEDYPIEDCDKKARLQRAIEIAEGVDPPAGFQPSETAVPESQKQEPTSTATVPSTNENPSQAQHQQHAIQVLRVLLQNPDDFLRIHSQVC